MPYVDVRSPSDIPKFESMVKVGPVIVLVYADWCGHCQRFKDSMWNEMANSSKKNINTAAIHHDMVDKTSMKNTSIEGYPTLFEVKPAAKSNITKTIPTPQNKEDLKELLESKMNNESIKISPNNEKSLSMITNSTSAYEDTFEPNALESLPPNIDSDILEKDAGRPTSVQGGGSLMETLLKVSADSAHAIVLAGSAIEISRRMKKRRHTKRKRSGKKSLTRRR